MATSSNPTVPVLLLKTRSHPHDAYDEYFSGPIGISDATDQPYYTPQFVPVLEHHPHVENLAELEQYLKSGTLKDKYGGMIFTSQRAVEGWSDVVKRTEKSIAQGQMELIESSIDSNDMSLSNSSNPPQSTSTADPNSFPLYTVGPATTRGLNTLISQSSHSPNSPFTLLQPVAVGSHTGNGEALAQFILAHYNLLRTHSIFSLDETPLPPNTSHAPEPNPTLQSKGLLFLVGETRRDIIPKTLTDTAGVLPPSQRIPVDEVEVYGTRIMSSFAQDFQSTTTRWLQSGARLIIVVVFSPQGCEAMLRSLGFIDETGQLTERGKNRWTEDSAAKVLVVTIGPTTRNHLKENFGFEPDVCAAKPSPEGLGGGIRKFLKDKALLGD